MIFNPIKLFITMSQEYYHEHQTKTTLGVQERKKTVSIDKTKGSISKNNL